MQHPPPGLAIHVGTGDCRDSLSRTSRLAAAAGITYQRTLIGAHASRAEVAWCLSDGTLPLIEVAALLGTAPPTAFITGTVSLTTIATGDAPKQGALFLITGQV